MAESQKEQEIARLILNHLRKNPDAADTLHGIASWWLEREQIETTVDEVANVLEGLLEAGVVEAHKTTDGSTIYRISNP